MGTEKMKCVRIEFEYDNGEIYRAVGEDAETIRKHIDSAETMNYIHGFKYTGPVCKLVSSGN